MLPEHHPRRAEFQALTQAAQAIGLFQDPRRIGFRDQWLRLVREKGYQIVGHELIPIANDETTDTPSEFAINEASIARHMTAFVRYGFSAPVQMERCSQPRAAGNPAQSPDRRSIARPTALGSHSLLVPRPERRAKAD
jgi:hypothetical protein